MYFRNYGLSKTYLEHPVKSAIQEVPLRVNMLKGAKYLDNYQERNFIIFFINLSQNDLENVSFIEILNPRCVC